MLWKNPKRLHFIVTLTLCAVGTVALWWFLTKHQNDWQHWVVCWFISVNLVTFAWYGLDKYLSKQVAMYWFRVPEVVLHTLSAIGGSPAALAAMLLFRHKTIKASFRILFWSIVVVQILLVAYIVKKLWWD